MDPVEYVARLHALVDELCAPLARRHAARLRCGPGCADCCPDGLTVLPVEAELVRRRHARLLEEGEPGPPGACAFLDEARRCRIYPDRPYVCRTQGLPLRWGDRDPRTGAPVERRDICPLNEPGGPPVDALPADACWTLGPVEARLRAAQDALDPAAARVPLRSLFRRAR